MRRTILVLSRQKPHLVFVLGLSILSGVGFAVAPEKSVDPDVPLIAQQVWAWTISTTGLLGLLGILWQRWSVERGMLLERGALLVQSGVVVVYAGVIVAYLGWGATVSVAVALWWVVTNIWEARLIRRDLERMEEVPVGLHQ